MIILAVGHGIQEYKKARKNREIEEKLPDALFQASSISGITSFEELIQKLGEGEGSLAEIFRGMYKQIIHGVPTEEVLEDASKQTESRTFSRAMNLLAHGYRTGTMKKALRETAEDINQTHEILRERSAGTMVEKYTLLIAGGCIVPLILGSLASMVSELGFVDLGMGMSSNMREAIIENATKGNMIYIAEYAVLASFFVSIQESRPERTVVYAIVLVPISVLIFLIAKNGIAF